MAENKVTKEQVEEIIKQLDTKEFNLYFFTLDTKGNPVAGVANIYEHVKVLTELGYKAHILHEKNDYKLHGNEEGMGLSNWLGEEYAKLPHVSIESQQLNIGPRDFIIIPEIFSNVMDQTKAFPCKKIVLSQSYDYLLELLPIGKRWADFGYNDVITTSQKQADYITRLFPNMKSYIVPVSIPSYFKPNDKPKMPIVGIHTRIPGDAAKVAKSFYLQYPIYKWLTFKDMRGLSRQQFADELKNVCLAVWIDDQAGFGTFPLEAMACDTPVIGKMPNMIPEWMEEKDEAGNTKIKNNGVWTNTPLNIPELIATYLKLWLEDSVPEDIVNSMKTTNGQYSEENQKAKIKEVYGQLVKDRVSELNKLLEEAQKTNEPQTT
jgi:hypothetical protein